LGDAEARLLVQWLSDQAELLAESLPPEQATAELTRLLHRARSIARFVSLWCQPGRQGPALQLAATERFPWPFPVRRMDPWELLQRIIHWENNLLAEQRSRSQAA
jgi:hypothetical protein